MSATRPYANSPPALFVARTDGPVEWIEALFAGEIGYATPKVDIRAAVRPIADVQWRG